MTPVRASVLLLGAASLACSSPEPDAPSSDEPNGGGKADNIASGTLWRPSRIPVCWEQVDPAQATERRWVEDAARGSWSAVAAVDFVGWQRCREGAGGIRIAVDDGPPHTEGLGTDLDGVTRGMVLNFEFESWSPGCQSTREHCIRAGAVHELGHAIGFAHEQNRLDTPDWCEGERGAFGDFSIGAWDLDSIMNYCNPHWTGDGRLSAGDVAAVQAIYGRRAGTWLVARAEPAGLTEGEEWLSGSALAASASLGDVTGDGRADAVSLDAAGTRVLVARSRGDGFEAAARWGRAATDLTATLLADTDGDGRADLVEVRGRELWRARSIGTAFDEPRWWGTTGAASDAVVLAGDVDGDRRADAIGVDRSTGTWWVAVSHPQGGLANPRRWIDGHGVDAQAHLLADVTGDGLVDAVVAYAGGGAWWVAASTGQAFGPATRWREDHGATASARLLGDLDGDGRADAVVHDEDGGRWWAAFSDGGTFAPDTWLRGGLAPSLADVRLRVLAADTDGDGDEDVAVVWEHPDLTHLDP